jgi:hypothetical protein
MVNAHGLPCRRCGKVTENVVTIYGPHATGALGPRQAQCKGPCPERAAVRQHKGSPERTMTAIRPGRCPACPRDILPGDVLAQVGGQVYHYECSPEQSSRDRTWQRERDQARRP